MTDHDSFLAVIRARSEDETARLVYADWLDERDDPRGAFIRLQLALKRLGPDHLDRVPGEHELSRLRKDIDPAWLAVVEPERPKSGDDPSNRRACPCFAHDYEKGRKPAKLVLHVEPQDTECLPWKRLLERVEEAASDGREEFAPLQDMDFADRCRIVTLPATIAKLKSVKRMHLYGSYLARIPPEIGEMENLEDFDPYTSYWLHWFPYEITRCKKLRESRVSTRALYGNYKNRPPFPLLEPETMWAHGRAEPARLSLACATTSVRPCSVCGKPFEDSRQHRVWISLLVATDVLPLLVNACSEECIRNLPAPASGYIPTPHRGGSGVPQPEKMFVPPRPT